jgi:hypothetical protein
LDGPRHLPIDPEEFGGFLEVRLRGELAIAEKYRGQSHHDSVGWSFSNGLYSRFGDPRWDDSVCCSEPPLTLQESLVSDKIDSALLNETTPTEPIVALDFGGDWGLSWIRIASQPRHKRAIEEGRLAMLV